MPRLLITRGRIIDPSADVDAEGDLLVEDGRILAVGKLNGKNKGADETIDARGLIVAPGLVDIHVHFREPGMEEAETIASGSEAAVAGGFATVLAMPNTRPAVDNEASAAYVLLQAARAGKANVLPVGAITKGREGKELAEIGQLARAGAVAFSDDGSPVQSAEIMRRALEYTRMFGKPILQHCQDLDLASDGVMHEGRVSVELGLAGMPAAAEEIQVERDIALAEMTGGRVHIAHLSTARAADAVRRARKRGIPVTAEVTPHHLTLTDESVRGYDAVYKMNPPLRTKEDAAALKKALADGAIDAIASDHAPHGAEAKSAEFAKAPFGVIGLESTVGVCATALVGGKVLDWPRLVHLLSTGPSRAVGLAKGTLSAGSDADVTLLDPLKKWRIDASRFRSKSRNCPFDGWDCSGKAVATVVGGKIQYREI